MGKSAEHFLELREKWQEKWLKDHPVPENYKDSEEYWLYRAKKKIKRSKKSK